MSIFVKYLVCYDIEKNKTRTHFFNQLKDLGLEPLQKSVFYGELNSAEVKALEKEVKKSLDPQTDKCLWFRCLLSPDEIKSFPGYENFEYIEADAYGTL